MKPAVFLIVAALVVASTVECHDDEPVKTINDNKKEEDKKKPVVASKPVVEEYHKPERPVFQIPSIPSFPIFPQIHFPQIHFPAIPIPQLPELPSLPSLPRPFKRETIRATKTVYIEKTRKVTKHPICVTALPGKLRPCVYNHGYSRDELENDQQSAGVEKIDIQPTSVATEIQATRILGDVTYSEPKPADEADSLEPSANAALEEEVVDVPRRRRQGRYIVRHPIPKFKSQVTHEATEPLHLTPEQGLRIDAFEEADEGHFRPGILKATQYITKTLWVTKIEDVIDHRVTATLLAKNCIPSQSVIPRCAKWKDESSLEAEKAVETESSPEPY